MRSYVAAIVAATIAATFATSDVVSMEQMRQDFLRTSKVFKMMETTFAGKRQRCCLVLVVPVWTPKLLFPAACRLRNDCL